METQETELIRRQYLVSKAQARKLERLSKREDVSATEIVRRAIEAYDPDADPARAAELESVLDAMAAALKETRTEVARLRARLTRSRSTAARNAEREEVRREVRAHFQQHSDELEALRRFFDW